MPSKHRRLKQALDRGPEMKLVCNVSTRAQKRIEGIWTDIDVRPVFQDSGYALFGFLANVRNYSAVPPLSQPRGLPEGFDIPTTDEIEDSWENEGTLAKGYLGDHSFSWMLIDELLAFDYDQPVEDRRIAQKIGNIINHGLTAEPGAGRMTNYRDLLGVRFFADLRELQECGAERVVFGFDD